MAEPGSERRLFRLLRRLFFVALVIAGLSSGLTALARTQAARAYVGREVAALIRSELGLVAQISDVHLDPRRLEVVVRGIVLDHPEHGRLARAAELRVRPSWRALVRGQLDLHSIRLHRPDVTLKLRDGVVLNGPVLPKSDDAADTRAELPINWLHVTQARVELDAAPEAAGELRNIELHVRKESSERIRLHIRIDGGFVRHTGGTERVRVIELTGAVSPSQLDLDYARVETNDLRVSVREGMLGLPKLDTYAGKLTLDLHVPTLLRLPLGVELPELAGELHVRGELRGDELGPTGKLEVRVLRGVAKQFGFGERVTMAVELDPTNVSFKGRAELIREGGYVDLSGKLGLSDTLPLKLDASVHEVGFAKLMEQLGVSPDAIVDWKLNGGFSLNGTCNPLVLQGPLKMPTSDFKVLRHAWHQGPERPERRILGVERALLDGTVAVTPVGIHLQEILVTMPTSKLRATVLLGFDNDLRVDAHGMELGLADASPLVDLAIGGRGSFHTRVSGTFSEPVVEGDISVEDYSLHGFLFGNLTTTFLLDSDMMGVHFGRIDAIKRDSRYTVEGGHLDFRNDAFRAGGKLLATHLTLADVYHVFGYDKDERYLPYQGVVKGEATLDYGLGRPGDSARGTLLMGFDADLPEAVLDDFRFKDGHFTGSFAWLDPDRGYRGGKLAIERFSLRKGPGTLSVSGRMDLDGKLDLIALADRLELRELEGVGDRMQHVTGELAVNASVKGTAAVPRADIDLTLTGVAFKGEPLGDGRAYVRLTDRTDPWIAAAATWPAGAPPKGEQCGYGRRGLALGTWPDDPPLRTAEGPVPAHDTPMAYVMCGSGLSGQVALDLAIGRTKQLPLRGRIAVEELDLARALPRVRGRKPMRGSVSAAATFTGGAAKDPSGIEGSLLVSSLRVGQLGVELHNQGPLELELSRGSFVVKRAALAGPSTELRIAGGGSFSRGLGLRIDGRVDLGLLTTLSQTVTEADGAVHLDFNVSGSFAAPEVFGRAEVREATLRIASFPEAIANLNGDVTFSARRILLERFRANVAGGTISLDGSAALDGPSIGSYELGISAEGLALAPRDGVDMKIGGDATLHWKRGERLPLLEGALRLDELVYSRPIKMDRTIGEMYGAQRAEVTSYDPEDDLLALDLRIEHSRPLFLRNNLIDAELRLENEKLPFRLVGTDQRFGVLGHVSVRKGTVRFRDAEFQIKQGDIAFDDETRIDPSFDLRAVTEVRRQNDQTNWQIQIHAFGHRDEFRFELTSDPYLTEDDIALLLTLGMTHSELAQLETGNLTSAAALEALASVTGVEGEVHKALPEIDDFHIASAYSEQTNRTEPQLFVGKRIAENLRLNASTGIAEGRDFSTGVELQLSDQTAVEAVYNNQNAESASQIGDIGVDLTWRLEFD